MYRQTKNINNLKSSTENVKLCDTYKLFQNSSLLIDYEITVMNITLNCNNPLNAFIFRKTFTETFYPHIFPETLIQMCHYDQQTRMSLSLSSFMEEEKMFYKQTISNAKKKKDKLKQKS